MKSKIITFNSLVANMIIRSNKAFEETVVKGLQLSSKGDYFGAVSLMKEHGISNKVIARVLFQQHQIRSNDSALIEQQLLDSTSFQKPIQQ